MTLLTIKMEMKKMEAMQSLQDKTQQIQLYLDYRHNITQSCEEQTKRGNCEEAAPAHYPDVDGTGIAFCGIGFGVAGIGIDSDGLGINLNGVGINCNGIDYDSNGFGNNSNGFGVDFGGSDIGFSC